MKSIKTLIKLYTRELDIRRRALKEAQEEREAFVQRKTAAEKALIDEQHRALKDLDLRITLPAFMRETRQKVSLYITKIKECDERIETLQHEIRVLFAEVKRYEIYNEMKEEEAERALALIEQKGLDELGIRGMLYKVE